MEILVILGILVVLLLVLGVSFLPVVTGILWLFEGMALLCLLFFVVTAALLLFGKKKEAVFLAVEKAQKYGEHAVYQIDGEEYDNLFPTDGFLKKLLYRKKEVSVRLIQIGENQLVFDRVSQAIVWIGLAAFLVISILFWQMLR